MKKKPKSAIDVATGEYLTDTLFIDDDTTVRVGLSSMISFSGFVAAPP